MSFIEIFRTCLSRCGFLQQSVLRWNIKGFKYIKVVYASSFAATIPFLSSFSYWVWGHDYSNESYWSVPLHCLVWEQRGNSKESTIKKKATEQYSPVVSYFVGSVHRALACFNLRVCAWNPSMWQFKWKLLKGLQFPHNARVGWNNVWP